MKRLVVVSLVLAAGVLGWSGASRADDGHPIAGVNIGAVAPIGAFRDFSNTGGVLSPYAGYMFNKYIGGQAELQILGVPNEDRPNILDDDATWAFGGTLGPRVAFPIQRLELYATGGAGFFTGLAPHSSITDSSWGWVAGGGFNFPLVDPVRFGFFGRYNRLYQRVHHQEDVKYVTAGIDLSYDFMPPPPPPPAPPVVAEAPPPAPAPVLKRKIVLRGVNFDFDKSNIRPDARVILDEAASILKQEGGIAVIAEGHTDGRGTEPYNQRLSERRAKSVRDYLVAGGVAASRIQVEGFGETRPVATNATDDGRAQNRRVELRVVGP